MAKRCIIVGVGGFGEAWCRHFLPPNIRDGLVEVAGAVDVNPERLAIAHEALGLQEAQLFTDAATAFETVVGAWDARLQQALDSGETFSGDTPQAVNEVIAERLEAYYFPPQVVVDHNIAGWQVPITADRKKVGRIIGNLLDNAHRKLEELKKGILRVAVRIEHPYAVIEIGNTGSIAREIRDDFYNHTKPLSSRLPGSGQGLDIVKLFTVMHNGVVELDSPDGADWTTFRVKLPL